MNYKSFVIAAVVCIVGAIGLAILAYTTYQEEHAIRTQGVDTQGTIVDKEIAKERQTTRNRRHQGDATGYETSKTVTKYYLNIDFADQQQAKHQVRKSVSKQNYDEHAMGSTIQIRYLPSHPSTVRLQSELEDSELALPGFIGAIAALLAVLGPGLLFYGKHQVRKAQQQQQAAVSGS